MENDYHVNWDAPIDPFADSDDITETLMLNEYYETVAYGFIKEAVETAMREAPKTNTIRDFHNYISENLV